MTTTNTTRKVASLDMSKLEYYKMRLDQAHSNQNRKLIGLYTNLIKKENDKVF
jgi:hypothetical protein